MTLEDDLRQAVGERQGTAIRFTDIDGIGQKTAQRIKQSGRIRSPSDISDKTAEELAEQAGISESRARKAIKGAGGDPDRTPRSNTGSVSAAGIRVPTGEFKPEIGDKDNASARFQSSLNRGIGRSQEAAAADKGKRAPVTTDFERWKDNKGELDFPGVDTPTDDPQVRPKDLRQKQRPATTDPPERQATATSRTFDRGRVFSNTTKTESVERGVSPQPNQGLQPVETAGVTGTGGFEGDKMGGEGLTDAGGARSGNVPQAFVDNLASGREADLAFTEAEAGRGGGLESQLPATLPGGFNRAEVDSPESNDFTEVVFRRDSEIPNVDDVVTVQDTQMGPRVFAGTDQPTEDYLTRARSFEAEDDIAETAQEAAASFGPDEDNDEQTADPFLTGEDTGGGTLEDLNERADDDGERQSLMDLRYGSGNS